MPTTPRPIGTPAVPVQSAPGSRDDMLSALDGLLRSGAITHVHFVHNTGKIPAKSTWHVRPRMVFVLRGIHQNDLPHGDQVVRRDSTPGEVLYILPRAWTKPTWLRDHRIFGIVCHQGFTRFLSYHNPGQGTRVPAQVWYHVHRRRSEACESTLQALNYLGRDPAADQQVACDLLDAFMRQVRADLIADHDQDPSLAYRTWSAICAWVEDHCHEPIDRASVARSFGLHPGHLSRLFTEHGDETFVRFLARRRLERADELLHDHTLPLAEVAKRSGFSSSGYFIKVYRAAYGNTPAQRRVRTP